MDNNDNDKSREPGSAVDATSSSPSPSPSPPGTYQSATPLFPPLNSPITTTATMLKRERDDRNVTCVSDVQAHLRVSRYVTHYFHLLACQDLCTHGASLRDMFVDEETKFTNRLQQVQEWLDELYATINTTNDVRDYLLFILRITFYSLYFCAFSIQRAVLMTPFATICASVSAVNLDSRCELFR